MLAAIAFICAIALCVANLALDQTFAWEAVVALTVTGLLCNQLGWDVKK